MISQFGSPSRSQFFCIASALALLSGANSFAQGTGLKAELNGNAVTLRNMEDNASVFTKDLKQATKESLQGNIRQLAEVVKEKPLDHGLFANRARMVAMAIESDLAANSFDTPTAFNNKAREVLEKALNSEPVYVEQWRSALTSYQSELDTRFKSETGTAKDHADLYRAGYLLAAVTLRQLAEELADSAANTALNSSSATGLPEALFSSTTMTSTGLDRTQDPVQATRKLFEFVSQRLSTANSSAEIDQAWTDAKADFTVYLIQEETDTDGRAWLKFLAELDKALTDASKSVGFNKKTALQDAVARMQRWGLGQEDVVPGGRAGASPSSIQGAGGSDGGSSVGSSGGNSYADVRHERILTRIDRRADRRSIRIYRARGRR